MSLQLNGYRYNNIFTNEIHSSSMAGNWMKSIFQMNMTIIYRWTNVYMNFAITMLNGRFDNFANASVPVKMQLYYNIVFQFAVHLWLQWNLSKIRNVCRTLESKHEKIWSIYFQKWKFITTYFFFFFIHVACNILVEGSTPFYSLSNYGGKRNCTLTSMTPSVVTLRAINIGAEHEAANYDVSFDEYVVKKWR